MIKSTFFDRVLLYTKASLVDGSIIVKKQRDLTFLTY
ncbi:hypothetical protein SHLI107390_16925 [Shewanella livingstonensis]